VIEVNRKILLTVLVIMAAAMLATSVNMALATTINYDYMSAGGSCVIDVPGHTNILILTWHGVGSYYHGSADRIMPIVYSDIAGAFAGPCGYENNPTRHAFSASLGTGFAEFLVKPCQIGIFRIGKTTVAYWTVPLVCPATPITPEVTIPPAVLIFEGHGDLIHASVPGTPIGNWQYSIEEAYYNAKATLFCPGWHYFGPVGEAFAGIPGLQAVSLKSQTWTWTGS
jgi:hypothetical protein